MFVYAMVFGYLSTNFWVFRCNASLYSSEYYLSYCADQAFGSYEHGAIFLGTDEESIRNLKLADVLILGNSRAQMAFSTTAIQAFFDDRNIKHFNLTFNGEQDVFPRKIIEKYALSPRIIIINSDYFFYNSANSTAKKIMSETPMAKFEYTMKAWVQPLHKDICGGERRLFKNLLCGDQKTQYRSRKNGRITSPNWPNENIPVSYSDDYPENAFQELLNNARKFKKFASDRKICLVITVVPSPVATPLVGRKIAENLGTPFIQPDVEGLTGSDSGHLNPASAEIWTNAFLKEFEPVLQDCL
ncbi:MAG: hypothetical protein A3G18_09340 [Rhodospirillales bacterium RIFCSPLOWO2_12_FULL_58_28]|nr:MAG: hypothetical protein A3H92_02330 [Rhodospirillales bacterium RIFCSPLOWO2_02_FULL_58_16]OHC76708.1 MAG: hypothetical protein A3G18_09340 [Rhodospirillales bacterium RIFCSPLOWO2_12_FULL_58_28]